MNLISCVQRLTRRLLRDSTRRLQLLSSGHSLSAIESFNSESSPPAMQLKGLFESLLRLGSAKEIVVYVSIHEIVQTTTSSVRGSDLHSHYLLTHHAHSLQI